MEVIGWRNALCISGPILMALAYKFIKRKLEITAINEVLIYGSKVGRSAEEVGLENLYCVYYLTGHAMQSVDVCVPSLESDILTKCLIYVHQKTKAKVRVAIHKSSQFKNLILLSEHGIDVKVIKSGERMEHDFILLDAFNHTKESLAIAVLGSVDYDTARLNCNEDITILTSEPKVVTNLKREFERVWQSLPCSKLV